MKKHVCLCAQKKEDTMENLIKRAKAGDPDAFTELMQSHMQAMYKTARAILHNEEDCADAISETILICWQKLSQLKVNAFFKTWMIRILINECNDIIRTNRNLTFLEEIPEPEVEATEITKVQRNLEFQEALSTLDEKYRLIIVLYYVDGLKVKEIGQLLKMEESTIRTRLARGRKLLADYYDPQEHRRKLV